MVRSARRAFALAVAAIVTFVAGPALAHFELVAPLTGFLLFDLGGLLGIVAVVFGVVGALRGRGVGAGLILGALLTVAFLAVALPARKYPAINDISTDTTNPPQFVNAGSLPGNRGRDMHYPGATFAAQQHRGYPHLAPLRLNVPPDKAFKQVEAAAGQMPNWRITRVDSGTRAVEGVATSPLFRFKDDFVITVRAVPEGSEIEMRSKSRDGKGDIGANAARIEAFFAKLQ